MPFNKKTAVTAGRKGGGKRWKDKDPSTVRKKKILISVSENEALVIEEKCKEHGLSRTELIIRAVADYQL